jgi:hypothetical protein
MLFINTKASSKVFVNKKFIKLYKIFTILLYNFTKLRLANKRFASYIIYIA